MTSQISPETLRIDMDEEIPSSKPYPVEPENEIIKDLSLVGKIKGFIDWSYLKINNSQAHEYSYYDKLVNAGLGENQAADIHALCDNVKASNNVKNVLAQSIAAGYVDKDAFRVMYGECPEMFDSRKNDQIKDHIDFLNINDPKIVSKRILIDYFLELLNI